MEVEKNYFYVNRKLLHSSRWLTEKFTRGQAWIDLFGLAQHTDSFFRVRGIKINIKRGQIGYSQVTLAKRWKWSRNKVRRFLKELEKEGDIVLKTKHQNCDITTIITILKYNKWQGVKHQTEHQTKHQKDTKRNTYNNVNNDKNVKNIGETPLKSILEKRFPKILPITEKKHNNKQWQDQALEAVKYFNDGEEKKGRIFKCYKINPQKAEIAKLDCEELGKPHANYFFKVFNEITKKED